MSNAEWFLALQAAVEISKGAWLSTRHREQTMWPGVNVG